MEKTKIHHYIQEKINKQKEKRIQRWIYIFDFEDDELIYIYIIL